METFYPNGFVVYSDLYYDESGMALDKTSEGGFAWILKDNEFDPNVLFPNKNQIRTLTDLNILKNYIEECENNEIQINIHFIFSKIWADLIDLNTENEILKMSSFLGYDYVSPDLDFSAVYEALNTDIYEENDPDFSEYVHSAVNSYGYFDNLDELSLFIKKRDEIINNSCQDIALDQINIVLRINLSSLSPNLYFPAQVWNINIDKLKDFLNNL